MNFERVKCVGCNVGGTDPHDHLIEEGSKPVLAKVKRKRGFGGMTPERRKEIASMGGKAAQRNGVAHQFTSDEARRAGTKGGIAVSQDRSRMAEIGKKGGDARASKDKRTQP